MTPPRPTIALTLGDVAGIGPELVARAVHHADLRSRCRPLVVGHPAILRHALELIGAPVEVVEVPDMSRDDLMEKSPGVASGVDSSGSVFCWNPGGDDVLDVSPGAVDPRAGRGAYDALVGAIDAARRGWVDAVTTAPLNKRALHQAGLNYPGHTEILAAKCGVSDFAMMLYLPPGDGVASPDGLGVAHVTLHTSIARVPALLSTAAVAETIGLVQRFMERLSGRPPRIGVCALNPHAGEDGLFGDEEGRIILPAVERARHAGINAYGPFPADTLLLRAARGEFDGVVAMYHDQGHIALKLLAFDRAVNVTLGLPIIRTSPSQGTAFDIAWQGRANPTGMIEAVRVAAQLTHT